MTATRGAMARKSGSGSTRGAGTGVNACSTPVAATGITMDMAQFWHLLQAVRPPQPPKHAQTAPPLGPSFVLTSGQANANQLIDHTSTTGIKLWQEVSASLPNQLSTEVQDTNQFCESLLEQTENLG